MIPLVSPVYSEGDREAVVAATAHFDGGEHHVEGLIGDLCSRTSAVGGVATASGTTALVAALLALGVGPGRDVIAPSYTCLAVLRAILLAGGEPVLVDNRRDVIAGDFNLDIDAALAAASDRTAAVVVPVAFGMPLDVTALKRAGIPIVMDVAMALGATFVGRPLAAFGDLAVHSFHASKMVSGLQGGAVTAMSYSALDDVKAVGEYLDRLVGDREAPLDAVESRHLRGVSAPMNPLGAALARSQLAQLDAFIARRRAIAEYYDRVLSSAGAVVASARSEEGVVHRYQVSLEQTGPSPVAAIRALAERGVEAGRGVHPPLHAYLGLDGWEHSGAVWCSRHMLSLPVHPGLTDAHVEQVSRAAHAVIEELHT